MNNLKPCPFCGGEDIIVQELQPYMGDENNWRVLCVGCGCDIQRETKETVISAWNTRVEVEE